MSFEILDGGMSDRLSPMLVKELRQGMGSRLFTGAFIGLQLLLLLFGLSFVTDALGNDPSLVDFLYWTTFVLPLLLLIPATAGRSIETERNGKTLELLLVSRLSAYRIVLGKWLSLMLQTALLISSALPYVILRYFLGAVDVWSELIILAGLLACSGLLSAVALGFGASSIARWIKGIVYFVFIWSVWVLLAVSFRGVGASAEVFVWVAAYYGPLVLFLMLDVAATQIAPPAENHVSRIRLLAFASVVGIFLFRGLATPVESTVVALAMAIALPVTIMSLLENIRNVPGRYAAFVRGNPLGDWLGLPLAPGWPGGVVYVFGIVTLIALATPGAAKAPMVWVALLGTLLVPAALLRLFFHQNRATLGYYLLLLILTSVPFYVWGFARLMGNPLLASVGAVMSGLLPGSALILELAGEADGMVVTRSFLSITTATSLLLLLLRGRRAWRVVRDMVERSNSGSSAATVLAEPGETTLMAAGASFTGEGEG